MTRSAPDRIYWRWRDTDGKQWETDERPDPDDVGGGEPRAWADFRDMGGSREPLKPAGEATATTKPGVARKVAEDRLETLQEREDRRQYLGIEETTELGEYASAYLVQRAREGQLARGTMENREHYLKQAVAFFGSDRDLNSIRGPDIKRWIRHLRKQPNGRGDTLAGGTIRKYLNALSNLYRYAASDGFVPSGYNPVADLPNKPTADRQEAEWLSVPEASLLLEAARTFKPERSDGALGGQAHAVVATFLLTGGRKSEVLGLDVADLSFDRRKIRFRSNEHRQLKTSTSRRTVPMWPQLHEILQRHVFGGSGPTTGLLFPSSRTGKMIQDTRKTLDKIAKRVGYSEGEVRTRLFRHTYCTARLQTFDGYRVLGEDEEGNEIREPIPVSRDTVAREMGHGGTQLVERVYGHLPDNPHRSEHVEFRVDQHEEELGDRLEAVRRVLGREGEN